VLRSLPGRRIVDLTAAGSVGQALLDGTQPSIDGLHLCRAERPVGDELDVID
jgi:hypothetical protein